MTGNVPEYMKQRMYIRLSKSSFLEVDFKSTISSEASMLLPMKSSTQV